MLRAERVVAEAEAVQHARAVVLDHDVGRQAQLADAGQVVGVLEVGDDAALVAVDRGEVVAEPLAVGLRDRGPGAHLVAGRALDLHHVGAEVGEQQGRERAGRDVAELDDPDAVERACVGHGTSFLGFGG